MVSGLTLLFAKTSGAAPAVATETCAPTLDSVTAEATYFARYEHFHILAIPVSILISPPETGYKVRTSTLDQGSLDVKALKQFTEETGLDYEGLKNHSHEVRFTQTELERIASGEKEVKITVKTPKGNLAHEFFFTAPRSALVKIQRARGAQ